jgi:hypothetical protein
MRTETSARRRALRDDALVAGAAGAVLSGVPSTAYALWRGADVLEGALAAGTLLLPRERRAGRLLASATVAHAGLSVGWAAVLAALLPREATVRWSLAAGLAIAALDLGLIGRRFERIHALDTAPQVADHLAYATTVAAVLRRRRARRR